MDSTEQQQSELKWKIKLLEEYSVQLQKEIDFRREMLTYTFPP